MTEDERQNLLRAIAEAHAGLSEVAFKLRRELTLKAPALKAAIKAEREIFRLKRRTSAAQHGPAGAFEQDVAFSSTELRKRGFSKHGPPALASAGYPPRSG